MLLGPCFRHYRNRKRFLLCQHGEPVQILRGVSGSGDVRGPHEPDFHETVSDGPDPQLILDPDWTNEFPFPRRRRDEERYFRDLSRGSTMIASLLLIVVMLLMFSALQKIDMRLQRPDNQTLSTPSTINKHSSLPLAFSNHISKGGF
jgi:hypothetical protein